jgi:hypothetical protein
VIPNVDHQYVDVAPGDEFKTLILIDEDGKVESFDLNKPLPDGITIK